MKPVKGQLDDSKPWPTPIGMGAHVSPDDFYAARERQLKLAAEEEAFEKSLRKK